jgi:hypothetical protein
MKKMPENFTVLALSASALAVCLLQACSGGGMSASSVAGQLANGVVTGFGSVFVDGVELEDANAAITAENPDGSTRNVALQMGQRVRVSHDGKGTASKVSLDAAVIGSVSSIDLTNKTVTIAGQKVVVNDDATAGLLTTYGGGYTALTDVAANDLAEVHGSPVYDATSSSYKVLATRLQKVTAITHLQAKGKISGLNVASQTFTLNGLTVSYASANVRPTGATLSNDLAVTVYAPLSNLVNGTVSASHLKVDRLQDASATANAGTHVQMSGQVSLYDPTAKRLEIQGVEVSVASATVTPSGAVLSNNAYVKVEGSLGADGKVTATQVQVRTSNTATDLAKVKLIGVISDFVDSSSFIVRGVPVDASGIQIATACPNVTLANDLPVQVTATQQAGTPVVWATDLSCQVKPAVLIRPVDGNIAAVNSVARSFTVTSRNATTTTVYWNDATSFVGLTSDALSTQTVHVEGFVSNGLYTAKMVSLIDSQKRLDDDEFRATPPAASGTSSNAASAWSQYRLRHQHH